MLSEISLQFFKCFESLSLPVSPLTLLTGTNASGKSTVLQALLLLHQTAVDTFWGPKLQLDGSAVSLGTLGDVVNKVHGRRRFGFRLRDDDYSCAWVFESDKHDISMPVIELRFRDGDSDELILPSEGAEIRSLLPAEARATAGGAALARLLESVSYVAADRTGPSETYPLGGPDRHRTVGAQGEMAPGLLHWFGLDDVRPPLCLPGEVPTLLKQTQAWLSDFFPGAGFEVQPVRGANLVTLGLRTSPGTDHHRPQNVGFGLSHILPIIVAALHARPRDLMIVENPEVHLHPRGQAQMGAFLARVAAGGVQVFVETHSDHVLNGVRRAVRDGVLPPDQTSIHFFLPCHEAEAVSRAQVVTLVMDAHGNIDHWPEGFFDQLDKDLGYLAGL